MRLLNIPTPLLSTANKNGKNSYLYTGKVKTRLNYISLTWKKAHTCKCMSKFFLCIFFPPNTVTCVTLAQPTPRSSTSRSDSNHFFLTARQRMKGEDRAVLWNWDWGKSLENFHWGGNRGSDLTSCPHHTCTKWVENTREIKHFSTILHK